MKSRSVWIAIASCLATLVVVLLAVNLAGGEKQIERNLERLYATEDPQFRRAMSALLGPQFLDRNKTEVLLNGDQIFAAMLSEIRQVRRTITFETYIYWSDSIGRDSQMRSSSALALASRCTCCSTGSEAQRWRSVIWMK